VSQPARSAKARKCMKSVAHRLALAPLRPSTAVLIVLGGARDRTLSAALAVPDCPSLVSAHKHVSSFPGPRMWWPFSTSKPPAGPARGWWLPLTVVSARRPLVVAKARRLRQALLLVGDPVVAAQGVPGGRAPCRSFWGQETRLAIIHGIGGPRRSICSAGGAVDA